MSLRRLHMLLKEAARDDQITRVEVEELCREAQDEGEVTIGERFTLEAALDAHRERFTPDAYLALKNFLALINEKP